MSVVAEYNAEAQNEVADQTVEMLNVPVVKLRFLQGALRGVKRDTAEYAELAASVADKGVLEPIIVRRLTDEETGEETFQVINGTQRANAAMDAGHATIPAAIRQMSNIDVLRTMVITNAVDVPTEKAEYAKALKALLESDNSLTKAGLAAQINKTPAWLDGILSLNNLQQTLAQLVDEGRISLSNGIQLASLPTEVQEEFRSLAIETPTEEFKTLVKQRKDAIRKAKLGQKPDTPVFTPKERLRSLDDIRKLLGDNDSLKGVADDAGSTSSLDCMKAVLNWVLNMDPKTLADNKAKWEKDQEEARSRKEKAAAERGAIEKFVAERRTVRAQKELELINAGTSSEQKKEELAAFDAETKRLKEAQFPKTK